MSKWKNNSIADMAQNRVRLSSIKKFTRNTGFHNNGKLVALQNAQESYMMSNLLMDQSVVFMPINCANGMRKIWTNCQNNCRHFAMYLDFPLDYSRRNRARCSKSATNGTRNSTSSASTGSRCSTCCRSRNSTTSTEADRKSNQTTKPILSGLS